MSTIRFSKRFKLLKEGAPSLHKEGSRAAAILGQELINGLHERMYLNGFFQSNEIVER